MSVEEQILLKEILDQLQAGGITADISDRAARLLGIAFDSLVPAQYDYISLTYTGSNLTGVVYKTGGVGGTVVSTLTLAYDVNNNLQSVTKT